jgi:hypothetical protein
MRSTSSAELQRVRWFLEGACARVAYRPWSRRSKRVIVVAALAGVLATMVLIDMIGY